MNPESMPLDLSRFPATLPEPPSYLRGVDSVGRPRTRNAIIFLRTRRESLQQKHFNNRSHHRHVLILALETPGSVVVDGVDIPLQAGEALLVLPFQFHHYLHLEQDSLRWLFVTFDLETGREAMDSLRLRKLRPDPASLALWSAAVEAWRQPGPEEAVESLAILDQLLLRLLRLREEAPAGPDLASGTDSWIARVESLIVKSVYSGWTLPRVAREMRLSERHLRTRFEASTGVSIRRFRANYQLHRAISLMREPGSSLGQVAELSGFRSQAAFNHFFRRETGQTPLAFRRTLG